MKAAPVDPRDERRGTAGQRARAALVGGLGAALDHLPTALVNGLCDAVGELWYRAAPGRGAVARGNLAHIVERLATEGRGSARARAAASDPAALERLVRAAFRHAVRTYAETFRGAAITRDVDRRLALDDPEAVDAAFAAGGPAVFATLHFGSMAAAGSIIGSRSRVPVTAPMETLGDPELQRVLRRARESAGVRIVGLGEARRELRAALARGEAVGLIADRDIAGGGMTVPLFGLPASLPIGPAYLALDAGVPLHVAAVRRSKRGRFRGRLVTLPHPPADLPRRARVEALLAATAATFEDLVADAPEQLWTVFFPIWDAVGPRPGGGASVPAGTPDPAEPGR
ncbi:MAG: lysophospholipid acyltransferase family protein [Chloroflexota bacterium]